MSQSLERFLAGFHSLVESQGKRLLGCRNPSKGSSPVSTLASAPVSSLRPRSQSLERFLAGFHPWRWKASPAATRCRNPSKGSSPVSTRKMDKPQTADAASRNPSKGSSPVSTPRCPNQRATSNVAIPRKVPRRFPRADGPSARSREKSQSLERFLAGFHCALEGLSGL